MKMALVIVQAARTLAQQYPEAAPDAAAINASVQKLMMKIAASQQTPESAAPPIG